MAMKRGKYKLKKRAERQEETRLRIARATLELHETLGPSLTPINAIAQKAGVGRQTVYNHFPDELSLLEACSALDDSENPSPNPERWAKTAAPEERLRSALGEVYAYYRHRERLLSKVLRDAEGEAEVNVNVREVLKPMVAHWEQMKESLALGWQQEIAGPPELLLGAIGLALNFQTWRTMVREQSLTDEQVIELMVRMVRCAAHGQ